MKHHKQLITGVALGISILGAASGAWARHEGPAFPLKIDDAQARAEERFRSLDKDDNGKISREEFDAAEWPPMHPGPHGYHDGQGDPEERAALEMALFKSLDKNGDGLLSAEEFSARHMRSGVRDQKRDQIFEHLDADGSGELTRDELPDVSARLRSMDSDGDGVVTQEEAMAAHRGRGRPEN